MIDKKQRCDHELIIFHIHVKTQVQRLPSPLILQPYVSVMQLYIPSTANLKKKKKNSNIALDISKL